MSPCLVSILFTRSSLNLIKVLMEKVFLLMFVGVMGVKQNQVDFVTTRIIKIFCQIFLQHTYADGNQLARSLSIKETLTVLQFP